MNIEAFKTHFQKTFDSLVTEIVSVAEQMLNQEASITLQVQEETRINEKLLAESLPVCCLSFFAGGNKHLFVLSPELTIKMYAWMLGEDPAEEINEEHIDGLQEAAQQIIGHLRVVTDDQTGTFELADLNAFLAKSDDDLQPLVLEQDGIRCQYTCTFSEEEITLTHYLWPTEEAGGGANIADILDEQPENDAGQVNVQPVQFSPLDGEEDLDPEAIRNVGMLMDVELSITVELGRKKMLISDILKLGRGSIVELEKSAGDPLLLFVNGRKLAEGEVVVVDDHFAIRITQLASPKERLRSLQ